MRETMLPLWLLGLFVLGLLAGCAGVDRQKLAEATAHCPGEVVVGTAYASMLCYSNAEGPLWADKPAEELAVYIVYDEARLSLASQLNAGRIDVTTFRSRMTMLSSMLQQAMGEIDSLRLNEASASFRDASSSFAEGFARDPEIRAQYRASRLGIPYVPPQDRTVLVVPQRRMTHCQQIGNHMFCN